MYIFHLQEHGSTGRIEITSPSLADGRCVSKWIAENYPYRKSLYPTTELKDVLKKLKSDLYEF